MWLFQLSTNDYSKVTMCSLSYTCMARGYQGFVFDKNYHLGVGRNDTNVDVQAGPSAYVLCINDRATSGSSV